jgi:peptide/nickel transport system permease protein
MSTVVDVRDLPAAGRWQGARRLVRGAPLGDRLAFAAFGIVCLLAVIGPSIAPSDPLAVAGAPYKGPSFAHPLGTDDVGRDMFSRVLAGVQSTWLSALAVIALAIVIGAVVGIVSATAGGWVDGVLMRVTDVFLALPAPLVAITVVAALGASLGNTLIAVSLLWWPYYARLIRSELRAVMVRPHVAAARLAGVPRLRLVARHVAPAAIPVTIVGASLDIGALIAVLAALSFLGLGAAAPAPELGAMTARGLADLQTSWWLSVGPGFAVFLLALVGNLAGDAIRDLLDRR